MAGRPAVLKVDIVGDAKGLGREVDTANGKLGRLGGFASKAGLAVGAGLAVAGVAAVKFGADCVSSASDAQQAFGAVDSIFGKHAESVKRNAQGAADAVGLSSTAYANMAAILGSQLTNMGRSQAEAASQTDNLIHLGADLAATYGGSVSDAVEAVSSLMKGETDPIERYGVSIKQSDINARLAAQGLDGLTGAAAKQAQATAVLGLLTKQTSAAHGQFAAQTDTLAERQQILSAKFDNIKVTIGKALLPVVTDLFGWFTDKLAPATARIASALAEKAGPAIKQVGGFISDDLIPAAKQIATWFQDKIAPILSGVVSQALKSIGELFASVKKTLDDNHESLAKLGKVLEGVAYVLGKVLAPIIKTEIKVALKLLAFEIKAVVEVVDILVKSIDKVISGLKKVGDLVSSTIGKAGDVLDKINPFGGPPLARMVPALTGGWSGPDAVGGLVTAAFGTQPGSYAVTGGGRNAGGLMVVDRRDQRLTVNVDGALDPVAVAHQLERILADHRTRMGAPVATG